MRILVIAKFPLLAGRSHSTRLAELALSTLSCPTEYPKPDVQSKGS